MTTVEKNTEYEVVNASVFELIVYGGVIGGIAGGLAFSLLILVLTQGLGEGFYSTVAGLFLEGNTDVLTGFVVHIGIAITFGIMFGLSLIFIPKLGSSQTMTLVSGIIWALLLWVIAAHVLMPLIISGYTKLLPDNFFELDNWIGEASIRSLLNHLIYGIFLAVVTWNLPSLMERLKSR